MYYHHRMKPRQRCWAILPPLTVCLWLCGPAAKAAAPGPGTPFDLQGFIDQEIKAGTQRIVVPPGRYRVTPKNRQHLVLRGLKDVQIIADGVEMICTETTRALTITRCTNVTVRGLVIDYDPLPFTQGRITGFSADKKVLRDRAVRGLSAGRDGAQLQI